MSQHAADLCVLLVENFFGELSSRTLDALFLYGRLSFGSLIHHTGFTPSQLRHSLAVLIQEHLAFWYTSNDDDSTAYEANPLGCYNLIRSGKYIHIVEESFGALAGALVGDILKLGHARVGDLVRVWTEANSSAQNDMSNGQPDNHEPAICNGSRSKNSEIAKSHTSEETVRRTLSYLISSRILSITNQFYFYADNDKRSEAEKRAQQRSKLDAKMKKEEADAYERGIIAQLMAWKHGDNGEKVELAKLKNSKKRPLENGDSGLNGRRPRLTGGAETFSEDILNDDFVLHVNHDKFMVLARNSRLAELAQTSIGSMSSQIYTKILEILEQDIQQCKKVPNLPGTIVDIDYEINPMSLPQLRTNDLRDLFTNISELTGAIGHAERSKISMAQFDHPKKRRRKDAPVLDGDMKMAHVDYQASPDESEGTEDNEGNVSGSETDPEDPDMWNEETGFDLNGPNSRKRKRSASPGDLPSPLRQHLFLLSNQPYKLLHHLPATSSTLESWAVDFHSLSHHLLTSSIFQIITARFGSLATRLIRILHQKGKLDEKSLAGFALINQKTMRALLTAMNRAGFLGLQEVPKGNDRQPSKMVFLWFFDEERCRQRMLDETYKTMTRVLQRIGVEREKVRGTIEKSERVDVQGREEEILSDQEKKALNEWRIKEERLLGELGKLDDMVAVLRDF